MAKRRRSRAKPVSLNPLEPEEALAGLLQVRPEREEATMPETEHQFELRQRVLVKEEGPGTGPKAEIQGKVGTIEGYGGMFAEGRALPLKYIPQYFVVIDQDDEPAYLVTEDWLEPL